MIKLKTCHQKHEINKNIWFSINLEDIKKFTGKTFNEYILYLEDENINTPKPKQITIDLPNNHFKYALTWYSISISIFEKDSYGDSLKSNAIFEVNSGTTISPATT